MQLQGRDRRSTTAAVTSRERLRLLPRPARVLGLLFFLCALAPAALAVHAAIADPAARPSPVPWRAGRLS
jgi:hypothetical protein